MHRIDETFSPSCFPFQEISSRAENSLYNLEKRIFNEGIASGILEYSSILCSLHKQVKYVKFEAAKNSHVQLSLTTVQLSLTTVRVI
jgi:hypothetical protein